MQCNLFLPKRRIKGKVVTGRLYCGRIKLHGESKAIEIRLGVSDRKAALAKLEARRNELEQEQAGILSPRIQRETASRSLREMLPEFTAVRERDKNGKYVEAMERQLVRLFDECGWLTIRDVTVHSFERWTCKQTITTKTLNEYLTAANVFFDWMLRTSRITANPLSNVPRIETKRREKTRRRFAV
ncbi:MAG: hypothetical protein ABL962_17875, partial [Fimbriimonadaceae bacterium]